jgi:hypothetical protein
VMSDWMCFTNRGTRKWLQNVGMQTSSGCLGDQREDGKQMKACAEEMYLCGLEPELVGSGQDEITASWSVFLFLICRRKKCNYCQCIPLLRIM